jgi:hypothetical protein
LPPVSGLLSLNAYGFFEALFPACMIRNSPAGLFPSTHKGHRASDGLIPRSCTVLRRLVSRRPDNIHRMSRERNGPRPEQSCAGWPALPASEPEPLVLAPFLSPRASGLCSSIVFSLSPV